MHHNFVRQSRTWGGHCAIMATVDLAHPVWSDVAAFLSRTDRFFLSAACSSCVHAQLRRDLFANTTWRVPATRGAADRVFRSLTMAGVIRRVTVDSAWQQEFLWRLSALESVHIAGLGRLGERRIELSPSLPKSIKSLRVSGFREVNLAALAHLTGLEELHLQVEVVHGLDVVVRLPKLSRLRLWNVTMADLEGVSRLGNLRLLESRWSQISARWLQDVPRLEKLVLVGWMPESLTGLKKVAPQLKLLTVQSVDTSGTGTQEDKDALVGALASVEHLDLCGTDLITASNISPIARLSTLRNLHLTHTLDDLAPLATLLELQELAVVTIAMVDWSPIVNLKHLRSVDQASQVGHWNPTSMPALQALPRLTQLKKPTKLCSDYPLQHVEELQIVYQGPGAVALEVGCCPRARRLWIVGSVNLATVGACFPRVKGLQCSKFEDCEDVNVLSLAELTRIEYVRVPIGCVDYNSFSFLVGLTNMRHVDLSDLPISDLRVLGNMKRLRSLFLDRTQVEDITVVAQLEYLRILYLRDTLVRDVSSLRGHPQLRRLILPRETDWVALQDGDEVALPNCVEIRQGQRLVWPALLSDESPEPVRPSSERETLSLETQGQ